MPSSEKGLYSQLRSEAGDKYPADTAQYAIDNLPE
ncbi:Ltp family lipoprotein [Sporosarcina aquimarina]